MGIGAILLSCAVGFAEPPESVELAPPPRLAGLPIAFVAVKGGYQVLLNRWAADRLQAALDRTDEKQVAAALRDLAKEKKDAPEPDEETAAKLELAAFVVASQLPGFKKALYENSGPGGAIVTLTGLQAPAVKLKNRPRLERAAGIVRGAMPLLPDDARELLEGLRAVGRTTPLSWTIEPR